MKTRTGLRVAILAATCLTPIATQALEVGTDPSSIAGVKPGMSYQDFHETLSAQGFITIRGQSVVPGANFDIAQEDGTVVASAFGYGADDGDRLVYVETTDDGQGGRIAIRVTGAYSLSSAEIDDEAVNAALDAKYGADFSCFDPAVGVIFQYDTEMQQLAEPDCSVLQPLLSPMPGDLISRSLAGDAWSFTATGVKTEQDGVVTLIESVQDNSLAAKAHAAALGMNPSQADTPARPVATPAPVETVEDVQPSTIDGFISRAKSNPMPAFQGLEFGMPLGQAIEALKSAGFKFRESFIPDIHRMKLHPEPIYYDTTMDIAFLPYPQSIVQGLNGKEPPTRFKGFLAYRKNADGSIDTAGGSIAQADDYEGIDTEAPLLRITASRQFAKGRALPIMDWLGAIRTEGQKFGGGCIYSGPETVKLFTDDGKITGRPHEDANGCWEWELVHEHRYRAILVDDLIQDLDVRGGQRLRKVELIVDDHKLIEEALRW